MKARIALFVMLLAVVAMAGIPRMIQYQGKLTDMSGVGENDTLDIRFRVFDIETGGDSLWAMTLADVPIVNGMFDVNLGPIDLPFDEQYWLEIVVDDNVLAPRVQLTSSPYAFRSAVADSFTGGVSPWTQDTMIAHWDSIRGVPAEIMMESENVSLLTNDAGYLTTVDFSDLTGTAVDAQIPSDITIEFADSAGALHWDDLTGVPADLLFGDDATEVIDTMIAHWDSIRGIPADIADGDDIGFQQIRANDSPWLTDSVTLVQGANITLTQTGDTIEIAGDGSSIWNIDGDDIYNANTGNVGIGTTEPATELHVEGQVYIPSGASYWIGNAADSGDRMRMHHIEGNSYIDYATGSLMIRRGITETMTFMPTGNVGIGTDEPSAQLHTTGTVRHEDLAGTGNRVTYVTSDGILSQNENITYQVGTYPTTTLVPGTVTIGEGSPSTTVSRTPFSTYYEDTRRQYLFHSSELIHAGLGTGDITAIALNVSSVGFPAMTGLTFKMKTTSSATLSGFEEDATVVWTAGTSYTPTVGWNTFTLSTPLYWDGSSNLIIEICYDNNTYSNSSGVYGSTVASSMAYGGYDDVVVGACSRVSWDYFISTDWRPDFQITGNITVLTTDDDEYIAMNRGLKVGNPTISTDFMGPGSIVAESGGSFGGTVSGADGQFSGTVSGADALNDNEFVTKRQLTMGSYSKWTTSGDNIYNMNIGNVGIGTTTPAGKLHVSGGYGIFDGKVGIGTTIPSQILHIVDHHAIMEMESYDPSYGGDAGINLKTPGYNTDGQNEIKLRKIDGRLDFRVGSNNRLSILQTGNVGIGNSAPSYKLDISGDVRITGALRTADGSAGTDGQILKSTGSAISWMNPEDAIDMLWTRSGNHLYPVNTTDSIGIGTAAPEAKLDIVGDIIARDSRLTITDTTGEDSLWIYDKDDTTYFGSDNPIKIGDSTLIVEKDGDVLMTKNVGIGTTTPEYKLDVDGDVRLTGALRTGDGSAGTAGQILKSTGSEISWANPEAIADDGDWIITGADMHASNSGNVGIGTPSPNALLHTLGTGTGGGNVLFTGEYKFSSPGDPPVEGAGTRMMWYPDKAAFRAGRVTGTQWDKDSIGIYSVAMGYRTTASGVASIAMGYETTAPSYCETVIGRYNTTYTPSSTGGWNAADRLFVIGNGFGARSNAMTVLKNGNVGIGTDSPTALLHTLGTGTGGGNVLFTGEYKDSPGDPPASGAGTRMMWYPDKAAFRAGRVTGTHWDKTNIGEYSIALGYNTKASGDNSTAMGDRTTASGYSSTAMGNLTTASGPYSVAMGNFTTASGGYSTAMGSYTTAPSGYETVIGRYNTTYTPSSATGWNGNDRLFVIGKGTSDGARSNAMTVLKNGNVGIGTDSPSGKLDVEQTGNLFTRQAYAGTTNDFGLYANSYESHSGNNYGVYGRAGNAGNNYGVFCSGSGGYTGSWSNLSDAKFKKNVRPMEGILDRIMMLKPKTFEMKTDEFSFMGLNEGTQYGLIAQELQDVFPELVLPGVHPGDEQNEPVEYLGVDYIPLTSILVRAVQEQQAQIEKTEAENAELRDEIDKMKRAIEKLGGEIE